MSLGFFSGEYNSVLQVFHRFSCRMFCNFDQLPKVRQDRGQEPQLARQRGQTRQKTRSVDKRYVDCRNVDGS